MEKRFFYEDSRLKNLEKLDNIYIFIYFTLTKKMKNLEIYVIFIYSLKYRKVG